MSDKYLKRLLEDFIKLFPGTTERDRMIIGQYIKMAYCLGKDSEKYRFDGYVKRYKATYKSKGVIYVDIFNAAFHNQVKVPRILEAITNKTKINGYYYEFIK